MWKMWKSPLSRIFSSFTLIIFMNPYHQKGDNMKTIIKCMLSKIKATLYCRLVLILSQLESQILSETLITETIINVFILLSQVFVIGF